MAKATLQNLGTIVREKRGTLGLRAAAAEIGTSAPTLSRIEAGKMPDLQTFGKLCRWLEIDPAALLGVSPRMPDASNHGMVAAHLKAHREIAPATASALAQAIIKAQWMLADQPADGGGRGARV